MDHDLELFIPDPGNIGNLCFTYSTMLEMLEIQVVLLSTILEMLENKVPIISRILEVLEI